MWETIEKESLVNGKIAPGTKGKFIIYITSNKNSKYRVEFQNRTIKPSNLNFYYKQKQYTDLEELEQEINGYVLEEEQKYIQIEWKWEYENGKDNIDTQDGKNINQYQFEVGVIGEPI